MFQITRPGIPTICPSGCLIVDKSCRTRGARLSHSRSEVIRSNQGAARQRQPVYRPRNPIAGRALFPGSPPDRCAVLPLTSLTVAHRAGITGSTLRLILRVDLLHSGAQRGSAHMPLPIAARFPHALLHLRRKLFPQTPPVLVKSTAELGALNTTGVHVAVDVRVPDRHP